MIDRILIVRTVSVEEFGPLLDACRGQWSDGQICVLTSPNRASELSLDPRIDEVLEYKSKGGGFDTPWNDGRLYSALIVPIRNSKGWGYGNVWQSVSGVKTHSCWIAAWGTRLTPVRLQNMLMRTRIEELLRLAGSLIAWPLARLFLLRFPLGRKG